MRPWRLHDEAPRDLALWRGLAVPRSCLVKARLLKARLLKARLLKACLG